MAVVAEKIALTLVDEEQLIAIGIADQELHRPCRLPPAELHLGIAQHHGRLPSRSRSAGKPRQIEGAGP
jgi:hypothetical protein